MAIGITDCDLEFYRTNGYLVVPGLALGEVEALRADASEYDTLVLGNVHSVARNSKRG